MNRSWLVLARHMAPYMWRLWSEVATDREHEVTVAYLPRGQSIDFKHETFGDTSAIRKFQLDGPHDAWTTEQALRSSKPDAVVVLGYTVPYYLLVALTRKARGRARFLFASDSNGWADTGPAVRETIKRSILPRLFDAALSLGRSNSLALRNLGFRDIIDIPIYAVDFDQLDSMKANLDDNELSIVCIARFVKKKNVVALAEAWSKVAPHTAPARLEFVGDGPERRAVEAALDGLDSRAFTIHGSVPSDRVGSILGRCRGLILPSSHEPWGIPVVEALGCGVPVVATRAVGSAMSLRGHPGLVLCDTDVESLRVTLEYLLANNLCVREAARKGSHAIRDVYSVGSVARRLKELLR